MSKFYGQPWIDGNSLVQEVITFTTGSDTKTEIEVLISDIWDNLKNNFDSAIEPPVGDEDTAGENDPSVKGYYKSPSKSNFFFWKVKQTPVDGTSSNFYIAFPCPEPKDGVFEEPYDPTKWDSATEPYAFYWVTKMKEATDNYEKSDTIQRKEVTFPGTSYIGQDGDEVVINDYQFVNNDLGDISNLLRLF